MPGRLPLLVAVLAVCSAAGATARADTTTPGTTAPPVTTSTATATAPTASTTTAPAPVPSQPPPAPGKPAVTLLFTGHGWGHGLGLSQWGAKGYAEHGWTYDRILLHYYTGTQLGQAPVASIRVLLSDGAASLALGSTAAWTVVDGDGQSHDLAAGKLTLAKTLKLRTLSDPDTVQLQPPLTFQPGSAPLLLGGKAYDGSFQVTKDAKGKLQLVDTVGLEDYVKGVVPAEMPASWPTEALKAQAVAARSYALAQRSPTRPFDVYADTRSQVYGGIAAESPAASAAVDATAGVVVLYGGAVADTMFSSSSGGRTADAADLFTTPVPYLKSVPDPYDLSPYRNWALAVTGAQAAKALHLAAPPLDVATTAGASGRVRSVVVTTATGPVVTTGAALRTALGLRSTWFTVGVLSLTAPAAAVPYGSAVTIAGVARGAPAPTVQQRSGSVLWTAGAPVSPASDGRFSVFLRPTGTTYLRLASGTTAGPTVRILVAPVVTLSAAFSGTVAPAAGGSVQIQQLVGTRWQTVATAPVDASGAFAASPLPAGTYRARYAPVGLAAGVSAPVTG
jgi:stage II sporulation protein D